MFLLKDALSTWCWLLTWQYLQIEVAIGHFEVRSPEICWIDGLQSPSPTCPLADSGSRRTSAPQKYREQSVSCGTWQVDTKWACCQTDPDVVLHPQTVRLVLVLLDLSRDLGHFPSLTEVDQIFAMSAQEVGVSLLRLQDVGQVNTCWTGDTFIPLYTDRWLVLPSDLQV